MLKQRTAILCAMLFSCTLPNAMLTKNSDADFQEYLLTGRNGWCLTNIESITRSFNALEAMLPAADLDNGISSPEYAAQLMELPTSEIAERYKLYSDMHNSLIGSLLMQQLIARRMYESTTQEESTKLQSFTQQLQERQNKTRQWLTAIRKSGEEHYLGVCHLNPTGDVGSKKEFWESQLKPVVLTKLKTLYGDKIYLNPDYMAVLRTQLDSDLDPS